MSEKENGAAGTPPNPDGAPDGDNLPDGAVDGGMGAEVAPEELEDVPEASDEMLSYKEVSEMSEVTQESYPEGYMVSHAATAAVEDLVDFEKLKAQTQKKLKIAESEQDPDERLSEVDPARSEAADEFLRNFFIKFGMKKTLDSFQ